MMVTTTKSTLDVDVTSTTIDNSVSTTLELPPISDETISRTLSKTNSPTNINTNTKITKVVFNKISTGKK